MPFIDRKRDWGDLGEWRGEEGFEGDDEAPGGGGEKEDALRRRRAAIRGVTESGRG